MTRIALAASAAVFVLASIPALAQTGDMAKGGAMAAAPETCQGMMDQAGPKMDAMMDGSKKTMAMKQMDMAKTAMSSGKEAMCMSHMKKAMKDMM